MRVACRWTSSASGDRLTEAQSRAVWRRLCSHWEAYRGTPVRYWLESELAVETAIALVTQNPRKVFRL